MKISIKFKIASLVFVIIAVVFIAVSIIINHVKQPLENEIIKKATVVTRDLVRLSSESLQAKNGRWLAKDVDNTKMSDPLVLYALVVDTEGKILAHSDAFIRKGTRPGDPVSLSALNTGSGFNIQNAVDPRTGAGVIDVAGAVIVSGKKQGIARVGYSKVEAEKVINKIKGLILLVAGIALLLMSLISFFVINLMVRPIEQLTQAVRLFGQGRLDKKIIVKTNDEVRELADSFNETFEILEQTQGKLRRRVRDVLMLFNAAKELNFSLDLRNLANLLLNTGKEHAGAKSAVLYLMLNEEETVFNFHVSAGLENDNDIVFDPAEPLFRYITKGRGIYTLPELAAACEETDAKNLENLKALNCEILAPVVVKDRIKGFMVLGPCRYERENREEGREFLSALMGMANVAIENSYLHTLSITDGLTKAYLRRYFLFRLEEELKRAKRHGRGLSVLMLDLDFFKKINDTCGHQAGDKVLKDVIIIIKGLSRPTDLVARYGGEEFAILAAETTGEAARIYAERIRSSVEKYDFVTGSTRLKATVSLGIACYPVDGTKVNELIAKADEMLYKAKKEGRNRVCLPEHK